MANGHNDLGPLYGPPGGGGRGPPPSMGGRGGPHGPPGSMGRGMGPQGGPAPGRHGGRGGGPAWARPAAPPPPAPAPAPAPPPPVPAEDYNFEEVRADSATPPGGAWHLGAGEMWPRTRNRTACTLLMSQNRMVAAA
jgi:hypothetical protein